MFQEDVEAWEHHLALVANEVERREGTFTVSGGGTWVVCGCGCDDFPGGKCKNCGELA